MINVNIDKFQGPLSLLLQIIEREELDITSVNLAKIADEYLEHVKSSNNILPEAMADFLLLATKLLYIKSKALLPYLFSEEDQVELEDLENKLKMYKEFIELSSKIQKIIGRHKFSFFRALPKSGKRRDILGASFFPPQNVNPSILQDEFLKVLQKIEIWEEKLEKKIISAEISIDERITFIKEIIAQKIKINFTKIIQEASSRLEIIVNFLAVLELAKQREIIFDQDDLFGEIFLSAYQEF
ncbi:MAG: segregation/condensation protein A [Patescibacteria group bacterium]|nr:segregation/condensation protein A [Patescibacteria group bacterium]